MKFDPLNTMYTTDDVVFNKMNLETKDGKFLAGNGQGKAFWWGVTITDDIPLHKQRMFTWKKKSTYHFKWKTNDSHEELERCKLDAVNKLNYLLSNANTVFVW